MKAVVRRSCRAAVESKARFGYRIQIEDEKQFDLMEKEEAVEAEELCDFLYISRTTLTKAIREKIFTNEISEYLGKNTNVSLQKKNFQESNDENIGMTYQKETQNGRNGVDLLSADHSGRRCRKRQQGGYGKCHILPVKVARTAFFASSYSGIWYTPKPRIETFTPLYNYL